MILAGPGLGDLRRGQAGRRAVPGGLHASPTSPAAPASPTSRCTSSWRSTHDIMPAWLAMTLAVVLVVISQIKINVTNAYSGSLAWTNSYTRVTKHYPGRLVFLGVNLAIALVLMEANMFDFLNTILGFYANCGMAWVVVVASDIAINKYLLEASRRSVPEFRRGMLYAVNPVGLRLDAHRRRRLDRRLLRRARARRSAVLAARRDRAGARAAAGHRARDEGPVLPAPHRRRHRRCRCSTSTATRRARRCTATSAGRTSSGPTWRRARTARRRTSARCACPPTATGEHVLPAR